jgi:hypothetical protein
MRVPMAWTVVRRMAGPARAEEYVAGCVVEMMVRSASRAE